MAAVSLAAIFLWPKVTKKVPGSLIVIILATVIHIFLNKKFGLQTVLIGDRYKIPTGLPSPKLPALDLLTIKTVFPTAVSIAVLAAIESLLSAVVADGMIVNKIHVSNILMKITCIFYI